jgi:hypothetical protein
LVQHGQSTAVTGRVNLAQVTNFENGLGHAVSEAEGGFQGESMVTERAGLLVWESYCSRRPLIQRIPRPIPGT